MVHMTHVIQTQRRVWQDVGRTIRQTVAAGMWVKHGAAAETALLLPLLLMLLLLARCGCEQFRTFGAAPG